MPARIFALLLAMALAGNAAAEDLRPGPVAAPQAPYNWQRWWVPITTPATGGHVFLLETIVYRPPGAGPFPLVTINHGQPRANGIEPRAMHPAYTAAAHWFVDRGFAVAVPMRRGFGASQGDISDVVGNCDHRDYFASARLAGEEIADAVAYLRRQSFVDPNNVVVVGHSYGGLGALGAAYDGVPGVVGVINFAGGAGSFAPGRICSGEDRLIAAAGQLGAGDHIPELWLYAANDRFFAPPLAQAMYDAYRAAARAQVGFVELPPYGTDGHYAVSRGDPSLWAPAVGSFLDRLPRR